MGRFTASLIGMFRAWDRSTKLGFLLALFLIVLSFLGLRFGDETIRQPALVGLIGSVIIAQILFMWGNRHLVTPYTQAQRSYLAEDFQQARDILERLHETGKADSNSLTLLANTYRQLGDLDKSEEIVRKAIAMRPSDHFPLYGFGRTLLVKGAYAQAAEAFRQAVEAGAPSIAQLDLAEALFRDGNSEAAGQALRSAPRDSLEPFRVLLVDYLRYRLGSGEPPTAAVLREGLVYWQETAKRFSHTPYGQSLAGDVSDMQALLEDV
jgi:tetratricopeptide (TPR) repeat protein